MEHANEVATRLLDKDEMTLVSGRDIGSRASEHSIS